MDDVVNWTQYLLAMTALLGMLGGLGLVAYAIQRGWILQQLTGLRQTSPDRRRLSITETLVLDPRRRVIILNCDGEEQVLLLGAERETVLDRKPAKSTESFSSKSGLEATS